MPGGSQKSPAAFAAEPVSKLDHTLSENPRQVLFKTVLRNDPFGTCVHVTIEPRAAEYPSWPFPTHREALAFAEELQRVHGWPISDRTEYAD
ncbi:hypothetical protein CAF53_08785 [Sphingobium sp. LB126]|uniref:hypothetical protein n=1 Tax=Sphingobium sp. LB126 TaxID=1983755 RepID=UPI000C2082CB|nr:hypothetical protein [Sphingobium sp. LB126]PJG48324.1 hypothetical protein CAF53_08785 [Sphingobium sp. LB126]